MQTVCNILRVASFQASAATWTCTVFELILLFYETTIYCRIVSVPSFMILLK